MTWIESEMGEMGVKREFDLIIYIGHLPQKGGGTKFTIKVFFFLLLSQSSFSGILSTEFGKVSFNLFLIFIEFLSSKII